MKNFRNKLILLLFLALVFPNLASSQDSLTEELRFEVNTVYLPLSISKETLNEAQSLEGLIRNFESSWIREYISMEIVTSSKGKIRKTVSKNDILNQEQKDIMNAADVGSEISVKVKYIPENTLTQNDIKELDFAFMVNPENEAKYSGGLEQLKQYLKENAIDKIPDGSFKNYDLTAIKFAVNEDGQIIDVHVYGSEYKTSPNEKIDKLLLETIRNMPDWIPAEYANGTKVKQEFVLFVGNMENCMIHTLNINQDLTSRE